MGKRPGGGAAGAAAASTSTSAGAGVEPAAGLGGGPQNAATGLLGTLYLVMTVVVAAARAEKEGGCRSAGGPRARPRGCHRTLAVAAAGLRPGGGRAVARGSDGGPARREVAGPVPSPGICT